MIAFLMALLLSTLAHGGHHHAHPVDTGGFGPIYVVAQPADTGGFGPI